MAKEFGVTDIVMCKRTFGRFTRQVNFAFSASKPMARSMGVGRKHFSTGLAIQTRRKNKNVLAGSDAVTRPPVNRQMLLE